MNSMQDRERLAGGHLTRCAGSLLSLLIILRQSRELDSFRDLRSTIDRLFNEFRSQLRDEGVSGQDIDDASYALAASFDEVILSAAWEGKDAWKMDSLAKRHCNDEFVGDGFYDKLAEIRRSATARRDVVEIFYYCLTASFQGRMIESPQQRDDLINEISHEIGTKAKALAPNGLPVQEGGKLEPIKRFPWPMVVLASVLVPVLIWLLSWGSLDRYADKIIESLKGI